MAGPRVLLRTWPSRFIAAIALLIGITACQPATSRSPSRRVALPTQSDREHVDKALEYLENLDQYREPQAIAQAAYHVNRWLQSQKWDSHWQPDEMVQKLPRTVRDRGVIADLTNTLFDNNDIYAIQEAVWMRQLSSWISRKPLPPQFARWLEQNASRLGTHEAEQLAVAFRLFDWTTRNVQLEELLPYPEEAAGAPADTGGAREVSLPAALRGEPGPGYNFEPWQVLIYGRADMWQRMRVFTLLARQQGIDAVTLAFPGRSIPPRPRPWVSGVLIKDQLFLFDSRLGLPIPGKNMEGIATLQEVLDDPALLSALTIDEQHAYPVDPKDLKEVSALIDATSTSLSQRFQQLESQLVGAHQCVLTVPLSSLTKRLGACRGIYDVYVWSVPFEAVWFHAAYDKKRGEDREAEIRHRMRFGTFANHSSLARARYLYFRGRLDNEQGRPGAKELLIESRIPRAELDDLHKKEEFLRGFGLERRENEPDEFWQARLAPIKQLMLDTKQSASFWLGLLHLESGSTASAIEWLKTRSLEAWPDGPWAPASRYNLARAHEAQGNLAKAQEILLADNSPQSHGNYLRARLLQKQLAQPAKGSQ
jgi:hypothetical protein